MIRKLLYVLVLPALICSCSSIRQASLDTKKYSPTALRKDYTIFRGALEEFHPSLYWFTPKPTIDSVFNAGYRQISDSMTEREFRTLLTSVITPIRCGHTSISYSRRYARYLDTADLKLFPLAFKLIGDTLAITANLYPNDSSLRRGTVVTAINNRTSKQLIDTFLRYTTGDGYSITGKYQSLSSYGTFGVLYKNVFGLADSFHIRYIDLFGMPAEKVLPVFKPVKDSLDKTDTLKPEKLDDREKRTLRSLASRSLQVDTVLRSGYISLNTFARGNHLKRFFRKMFRDIDRLNLEHLVIDVRSNGGGDASNSTLLTQYLSDHSFVIGDSLYAVKRSSRYRQYIPWQSLYWLMTTVATHRERDGHFHFGYFERHRFKPIKKHHYNGKVYLLTGGNSFSATTLFVHQLKGQKNVTVIGEETGGGGYGNTAWVIPELVLPHSRLRVSIPKFRFVMDKNLVAAGRGVLPDITVAPTTADIRYGIDVKIQVVKQLILQAHAARLSAQ